MIFCYFGEKGYIMKDHGGRIGPFLLSFALLLGCFAGMMPAQAAGSVYVNDGQSTLSGSLTESYAVGSGGVSNIGGSYAITSGGVKQIGASEGSGGTATASGRIVRVGLDYYYSGARNSAVSTASLKNSVGQGYQFGYYDSARIFHNLGYTGKMEITVLPCAAAGGNYCIKLRTAYQSFDAAQSVAAGYNSAFPAYLYGQYFVLIGGYSSAASAQSAMAKLGVAGDVFTGSSRAAAVSVTNSDTTLFMLDCGTDATLAVHPTTSSGKAVTSYGGKTYYGDFEFLRFISDAFTVINCVGVDDYVKGSISMEMEPSWPIEALKAQAVCARSYYYVNQRSYNSVGFDVTDDGYSQSYVGTYRSTTNSNLAAEQTAGQYLTYGGNVCSTFYFSSDGGGTENCENVFTAALPYLRGVSDPYEEDVPASMNSYKSWSHTLSGAALASKLSGYTGGPITDIQVYYSDTNNVIKLVMSDENGASGTLSKSACCTALGLPSIHYTVTQAENGFVFSGGGWGHNVGMSQWGAYSMAHFHGMSYTQILQFYFTGTSISTLD